MLHREFPYNPNHKSDPGATHSSLVTTHKMSFMSQGHKLCFDGISDVILSTVIVEILSINFILIIVEE